MKRRKFLVGTGALAAGGAAALGSGAFSRVESQRDVTIEVAKDPDAYLGLDRCDSENSRNYTDLDENGHGYVHIAESGNGGYGVNSDSYTWFDDLFQVCNQGKADMDFYIDASGLEVRDGGVVRFYTGTASGSQGDDGVTFIASSEEETGLEDAIEIELGHCVCVGLKTETHGVDATSGDPLVDGTVTLVADAPGAGASQS